MGRILARLGPILLFHRASPLCSSSFSFPVGALPGGTRMAAPPPYASNFISSRNRCSKRCGFHVRDYRNLAILSPYLSSVSSSNRWRITWRRFNRTHQKSRGSLRSGRFLCYQQSLVQRNPRFDLRTPSEILAELPIKPSCAPFLLTTWGRTVSAVNAERSRRRRRRCSRCSLLAGTPL